MTINVNVQYNGKMNGEVVGGPKFVLFNILVLQLKTVCSLLTSCLYGAWVSGLSFGMTPTAVSL